MSDIENISRRGFLKGLVSGGALILSVRFGPAVAWAQREQRLNTQADRAALHPSV